MSNVDDLLAGGDTPGPQGKKKPAAKPAAKAAKPAAKAAKAAKAAPAKAAKPAAKAAKAAPAKAAKPAAKVERGAGVSLDSDLARGLCKLPKNTPYADAAERLNANIRTVRRVSRALRDAGRLTLSKEGTVVSITPVRAPASAAI